MKGNKIAPQESKKLTELRQLVSHFNNSLANLKSTFATWESMNDTKLIAKFNKNISANTYEIIRHSLLLTCTMDIANLAKDSDNRSLSLVRIMKLVNDKKIETELLNIRKNTKNEISFSGDMPPKEYIDKLYAEQTIKRLNYFNEYLNKLKSKFVSSDFKENCNKFWSLRSKIVAHKDLFYENGNLILFSNNPTNINFEDIGQLVKDLEEFNNLLHAVVESSDVGWEGYDSDVKNSIFEFWKLLNKPLAVPSA